MNNDGTGNSSFHHNITTSSSGDVAKHININTSSPSVGRSQEIQTKHYLHDDQIMKDQFELKQMYRQDQCDSYKGRSNDAGENRYEGMMQQQLPLMNSLASTHSHYLQANSEDKRIPTFAKTDNHSDFGQGRQQRMARSLPPTHGLNGGLICSNENTLAHSMPEFQGKKSLEELRANVYRQEMQLRQLEQLIDKSSSRTFHHPSTMSFLPSHPQTVQQSSPPRPLFHREDPLSFCQNMNECGRVGNQNNDDVNLNHVPPLNWEEQSLRHPEQAYTNLARTSTASPLPVSTEPHLLSPSGSSQTKRRRLDSDQMLHMFLSDTIIESPGEIAGKKSMFSASALATADSVDRRVPLPPFVGNDMSLLLDQAKTLDLSLQSRNEASTQQASITKKTKQGTTDTSMKKSENIITPSTATISELTAEIRSQARKRELETSECAISSSDKTQDSSSDTNQDDPTNSAANLTGLVTMAAAMEASQTSQQNIHDWDKRFGLKRAHSKTMRESCRSRKKVLDFLQGVIKTGNGLGGVQEISSSTVTNSTSIMETEDVNMTSTEQLKDDCDALEKMFRRTSLECMESIVGKESPFLKFGRNSSSSSSSSEKSVAETLMPNIPSPSRVQYHARCA